MFALLDDICLCVFMGKEVENGCFWGFIMVLLFVLAELLLF